MMLRGLLKDIGLGFLRRHKFFRRDQFNSAIHMSMYRAAAP